jgi:RNA polymerase sigma-70 factor, ECF subfamily
LHGTARFFSSQKIVGWACNFHGLWALLDQHDADKEIAPNFPNKEIDRRDFVRFAGARLNEAQLAGGIDAALFARAQQGETIAFEVLVVKYQRRVAATIRRIVREDRIAEELTQEVFLSVFVAMASFRPDGDFAAWLFTIARNAARSYLRSAQNRQDDRPVQPLDEAGDSDRFGVAPSSEEEAMAHQLFERIDAEVAALPEVQRRALLMREIDGLEYKAIAAALEQPVNTVKSHIFRAREAIASGTRPLLAPTRDRRW